MPNKLLEREDWLRHARAWKKSGLSCVDYSRREGLKPSTLSWWTWKLRETGETIPGGKRTREKRVTERQHGAKPKRRRRVKATAAVSFVELAPMTVEPPEASTTIELDVRGLIVRVRAGFDEGLLARVLDAVEARR